MSAPALIFDLTAILAIGSLMLRRRPWASLALAAVGSLLIGIFALSAPIEIPHELLGVSLEFEGGWRILGRLIALSDRNRAPVAFLYLTGALFFAAGIFARPGRTFAPVGLLTLGLLGGSLTIEPFLYAAIFLELAAMAAILVLNPPETGSDPGSLQLLVLYTLAMIAILFTGWLLDNVGITSVTPELASKVMSLLALGFAILMFIPPFHFWLGRAAETANPYSLAFLAVVLQSAGLFFLLRFLDSLEWLRSEPRVFGAGLTVGLLMAGLGSLASAAQTNYSKMIAYALVADFGVTLFAIGSSLAGALQIVLFHLGIRVVSLAVWGLGATALRRIRGDAQLIGAGRANPLAACASLIGALGLAGFPVTGGFPIRWALLREPTGSTNVGATIVLASMVLVSISVGRWATRIFSPAQDGEERSVAGTNRWIFLAGILVCLLLGAFPQLGLPWVGPALRGFANLQP